MKWANFILEKHRILVNIVGTAIIAWLLSALVAQGIAMVLPSPKSSTSLSSNSDTMPELSLLNPSRKKSVQSYMPICERNLFDSEKRTSCNEELTLDDVEVEPAIDLNAEPVKSDLAAKLLGTMVLSKASRSFATISPANKKESITYKIGDEIMGEAKLYEIVRNKVFFVRNGRREFLEVDKLPIFSKKSSTNHQHNAPKNTGINRNGDNITLSRAKVESTLADLNKVIQQSRMVPNYQNGKVNGFKIFAIRKGSIFDQLGLKNGDIIQQINGTKIDSIEKALPMLEIVKTESSVSIDITRRGSKKTMSVKIQ